MSLSDVYVSYTDFLKEEKVRDPLRLFVSDIGKCPRQIAYRMTGTEMNYQSEQARVNKEIMFSIAGYIEEQLSKALAWRGELLAYQPDVEFGEARKNWGGRADILAEYKGRRIIEVKTVHPNAFKFGLDYPEHHMQAKCYDFYMRDEYSLDAMPMLVYFDRGGQNTAVEKVVEVSDFELLYAMDKLEMTRDMLPDMPEQLPKMLKLRSYKKEIVLEPDYRCTRCNYSDTCKPNMGTQVWAKRENVKVPFTVTKKAVPELLIDFANRILEEVV